MRFEETDLELRTLETNFEAEVEGGGFKLGKKKFELLQFHFHNPSEHMVGGERTPLEAHFVHLGEDGSLAVLAVFVVPRRPNREIDRLIGELDEIEMPGDTAEVYEFDPSELPPRSRRTFRYKGSTTTPPCVADVRWIAFAEPITFSED